MKTAKCASIILWIMFFVLPVNLLAQVKEIPITSSSKEALDFFLMGRDKSENFETAAAAELFDKAIQKDPEFAMAYLLRSFSGGGYNVYRQNLDKAISLAGKVSEGEKLTIKYAQASADGKGQEQKEILDQLLKLFPSDKRVQETAGAYYYSINDYKNALVHYSRSTELDPKYASAYNMIGYTQSALNNFKEAEKAFQTYTKLTPNSPNGYDSYAELLLKMGKYDESIAQYKKALEINPAFSFSIAGIGNNYIFKGDYATARKYYQEYFDKASTINNKFGALFLKATSYVYEGKIADAIKAFDEYSALAEKENLAPNVIWSYAYQGFILCENGNPTEGIKKYEKAFDLISKSNFPESDKENLEMNAMFWRLYYLTVNNELDKASAEAEKCKQKVADRKNPGEEMALGLFIGFLEFKKGNYDKAIQHFAKADQEDPVNLYYTGLALSKKGDKQGASKQFEKISKNNINSMSLALVRKRAMDELKK